MANLPFPGDFGLVTRQLLTRVGLEWRYCAVTTGGGHRTCRQAVAAPNPGAVAPDQDHMSFGDGLRAVHVDAMWETAA